MLDLINKINENAESLNGDETAISELYDKFAPALYGRIIMVVKQKDIAEKILERVFVNALIDKNVTRHNHVTLFTTLLNHSRKKTYGTMKALRVLEACCGAQSTIPVAQ